MMGVHFWFPPWDGVYFCDFVPLAEGLKMLNVPYASNRRYWDMGAGRGYLFPCDCDIERSVEYPHIVNVLSHRLFRYFDELGQPHVADPLESTPSLLKLHNRVLIDMDDGYETGGVRYESLFEMVFRAHLNKRCWNPGSHYPWALGMSQRMLEALPQEPKPFNERNKSVLINFGASHGYPHRTRCLFTPPFCNAASPFLEIDNTMDDLSVEPTGEWDRLMWQQTQKRHSRAYYTRLANSVAVAAFCGDMIPAAPFKPSFLVGGRRALVKRWSYSLISHLDPRPPRAIQSDSWRFWEALSAGCLVFNIDLAYYGVRLPIMPVNGVHYVGLRLNQIEADVGDVLRDPKRMEAIAMAGRQWALANYAPKPTAERFLTALGL